MLQEEIGFTNEEIYRRVGMNQDIVSRMQQRRLRYFGHVSRLQDNIYPKITLQGRVHGPTVQRKAEEEMDWHN